jgi:peptide/nickel transport system substrate-binding protein
MLLAGGAMFLTGCVAPATDRSQADAPADARTGPSKTLRTAVLREPSAGLIFGGGGNAAAQVKWMFHMSLTRYDPEGNLHPHIAAKLPSISDGDWKVLPDGGMELTWKLRPNVKWHDGTSLSAEDFAFGVQVAKDPTLNLDIGTSVLGQIREVSAPDPQTFVMRWAQPFFDANVATPPTIVALPRHILADLYQQGDTAAFMNNSYWTTTFIGLGPYRLTEWVLGSHTEAAAFDDYFLGRPKIDRVIIRYIPDANAMVAALLSGDIDMVNPSALKMPDLQPVMSHWGPQGGTIIPSLTSIVIARLQFRDPSVPWAQDARVRQALVHLLDRQTLADELEGVPEGGPADIFISKNDPVYRLAEQRGFARFPYDTARAGRMLADAGWTRGSEGLLQNASGQRFRMEVTIQANSQVNVQYGLSVADQWKQGGLETENRQLPPSSTNPNEMKARSTGVWLQAQELTSTILNMFETSQMATPQNNWVGNNLTAYSNPEFERRWADYLGALDLQQRQSVHADLLRWMSDEVVYVPLFYAVGSSITAHRRGVRGPAAITPAQQVGTWNIHEWEMD